MLKPTLRTWVGLSVFRILTLVPGATWKPSFCSPVAVHFDDVPPGLEVLWEKLSRTRHVTMTT